MLSDNVGQSFDFGKQRPDLFGVVSSPAIDETTKGMGISLQGKVAVSPMVGIVKLKAANSDYIQLAWS